MTTRSLTTSFLATLSVAFFLVAPAAHAEVHRTLLTFAGENTHSEISVRHYTDSALQNVTLSYQLLGEPKVRKVKAELREIEGAGRFVYVFDLKNLKSESRYDFKVLSGKRVVAKKQFMTFAKNQSEWRFVSGGDVGVSDEAARMFMRAAKSKPDVVLLGGDLAYSNGRVSHPERWDAFLGQYERAFTDASGRLTPIIASIGNHEVLSSFYAKSKSQAPFFFPIFADPNPSAKEGSFFKRRLGKVQLLVLDTAHIVTHDEQKPFIEAAVKEKAAWRLALYHVPLYPSHRDHQGRFSVAGRKAWQPLFEEHVDVAFENHDHILKRTKPIGRTTYLGDGCFGRPPRRAQKNSFLVTSLEKRHVWVVQISDDEFKAHAISLKGEVLDRVRIKRETPMIP